MQIIYTRTMSKDDGLGKAMEIGKGLAAVRTKHYHNAIWLTMVKSVMAMLHCVPGVFTRFCTEKVWKLKRKISFDVRIWFAIIQIYFFFKETFLNLHINLVKTSMDETKQFKCMKN